jgi:hypothetical protein
MSPLSYTTPIEQRRPILFAQFKIRLRLNGALSHAIWDQISEQPDEIRREIKHFPL